MNTRGVDPKPNYNFQELVSFYHTKFLVNAITESKTFFGKYCGDSDAWTAAYTIAPFFMYYAERTICLTFELKHIEKIELAFLSALKMIDPSESNAKNIVDEYLTTYCSPHAKSQIANESFRHAIILLLIETINGRMRHSHLKAEFSQEIIDYIDNCYNNVVINSKELGPFI